MWTYVIDLAGWIAMIIGMATEDPASTICIGVGCALILASNVWGIVAARKHKEELNRISQEIERTQ